MIEFTTPILIQVRSDGLSEYQYNLIGDIQAKCTTFCKTLLEAIENAKETIRKYLGRAEFIYRLSELHKQNNGLAPANTVTGWDGISLNQSSGRWDVEIVVNEEIIEIGDYAKKSIAVTAIRNANLKYGIGEFTGKINNK